MKLEALSQQTYIYHDEKCLSRLKNVKSITALKEYMSMYSKIVQGTTAMKCASIYGSEKQSQ